MVQVGWQPSLEGWVKVNRDEARKIVEESDVGALFEGVVESGYVVLQNMLGIALLTPLSFGVCLTVCFMLEDWDIEQWN